MYKRSSLWRRILTIVLILAIVFGLGAFFGRKAYYHFRYPVKYADLAEQYAAEYKVDKNLILSVINVESGFDPEAASEAGAVGLMQMTEEAFDWIHGQMNDTAYFEDLIKPEVSIQYGTKLLALLLKEYHGDVPTAMAAYHAGRGSVHSWLEQGKYSSNGETLDEIPKDDTAFYVQKIERAMGVYEKRLKEQAQENENVHRLRVNFARFVDAYVVPLLDNLFDKIGERFGNKLQSLTFLVGAGR